MVLSKEDKVLIKSLYELQGYNAQQFMMEFPNKGWKNCSTNRLLQMLRRWWYSRVMITTENLPKTNPNPNLNCKP